MKSKNSTKETIKQWLHVSASPKTRARIWREVLFVQERSGRANPALVLPYIWRTIMRSPITKLTATTVMVIAVVFLTTFLDKATTPLYALEQTIEANHTTKTIHLRMFKGAESIENNEFSNYWIKYDDAGKLSNLRCNEHDDDGVSFTVWNNGIAKTWIPENNVVIIIRENNTEEEFEDFAKEYDPKLSLQRLYDLSKEEEIELKIAEDSNSIYVNAIHSGYKERVDVVVDRQTKLMKKFSKYRLKDQEYKLDMQIEFLAYNKPIDMSVFQLSGIPDDALVYDKVNQLVGLKKGDLTKEEIADRVVHEALQATIAKDYDEVSRLIGGDPGDTIEEFIDKEFEGRLARIISIGQPKPDEKFKHILCVPCEIEVKSEESERSIAKIIAKAASIEYQPGNRWIMRTDLRVSEPYIPLTIAFNEKDLIKDNLIVLGERIGEYTLGMSKDEVLRKLGEPEAIYLDGEGDDVVRRGEEKYNLNNLPNEYVMVFGDISFWIDDESVKGTFVRSPLYKLSNGLGVGDSVQKIKAFGDNFQLEKAMGKDFRCYHAKGLAFGIHEKSQTIAEIVVYEPEDNRNLPDQQEYVKHTIVPGLCVGDYTLGMSKDDVLKKLGKPKGIFFGGERYTLDDLPRQYFLFFGDISFRIKDDAVIEIGVHSPLYKFPNGVRVGDSEQKIRQAFGDNFQLEEGIQLEEGRGKDFLTYEDKGVHFEISKRERTVMEIGIRPTAGNHRDSDTPDSYKAIIINEQPTGPIKFPKIDRRPPATNYHRGKMTELPTYDADSTDTWQVDLRAYDLSMLDLRDSLESLFYADFDDRTVWPSDSRMPQDFYPRSIMELGKNPGLGIRDLHSQGITGKSVGIAIIDQTLLVDHKEYKNQLRFYEETDDITGGWLRSQMHGPAVASIAVGKTVGVAPEADLYYIATARGGQGEDFSYLARSIRRVLQVNEQLPKQRKIRVIAMAIGWGEKVKGYEDVTEAAQEAKDAGMLVICSSVEKVHGFRFHGLGRHPLANPNVFESYEAGLWWAKKYYDGVRWRDSDRLLVPMDSRTTASPLGNDEYVFYRQGGWSWAIPYIAGVYALAAQVEPAITPEQFWSLAIKTGNTIQLDKKGKVIPFGPIIDPVRLIRSISDDVSVSQRMPLKHTIVPGIRIGDYTIGMSKD
ncbi:MAG: S8 family serine peptidase, partial [Candidatus Hodarchaeota archaeon]